MLSWERRTQLAETALQRSEAGRTRLRQALAEQRATAEEQGVEMERQLLTAQRQLREMEAAGGGSMTDGQLESLRGHIEHLIEENVKVAMDKEVQAQRTAGHIAEAEKAAADADAQVVAEYDVTTWDYVSSKAITEEYMQSMFQCVSSI